METASHNQVADVCHMIVPQSTTKHRFEVNRQRFMLFPKSLKRINKNNKRNKHGGKKPMLG